MNRVALAILASTNIDMDLVGEYELSHSPAYRTFHRNYNLIFKQAF